MLVALSDLHFQDVELSGAARVAHNTTAAAYRDLFETIRDTAEECKAREIILLLAGDIFDFLRTERWFDTEDRPYDDFELTSGAQAKVVEILDHTEHVNRESIRLFQAASRNDAAWRFPAPVRIVYVPGNHDRYLHLVPEAARRVRDWFGITEPFPQTWTSPDYQVFARHGHEYDWLNAEYNFEFVRRDIDALDDRLYRYACLGDWLAIDIATRIPFEFHRLFGNPEVYRAIVEIDDVRPMTSVFEWLQSVSGPDSETWKQVRRAIEEALRNAFANDFVARWIADHDRPGFMDRVDFLKYVVKPLSRNVGLIPDAMVQTCLNLMRGKEDRTTEDRVLTDVDFQKSGMPILIHGHFHDGGVSFLDSGRAVICCGSWRAQFTHCHDQKGFFKGRRFSTTMAFTKEETRARGGAHYPFSFEHVSRYASA